MFRIVRILLATVFLVGSLALATGCDQSATKKTTSSETTSTATREKAGPVYLPPPPMLPMPGATGEPLAPPIPMQASDLVPNVPVQ